MENPDFESRQFVAYALWREHRLEFSRDGKTTRLIINWCKEPNWVEKMTICRCFGGALFDPDLSFTRPEHRQFLHFVTGAHVSEVLEELRRLGPVEFNYFKQVQE